MALRRLYFSKKSALATRDYSPPPIGFPWLAAVEATLPISAAFSKKVAI
ncbi:MAG: hypothetical protein KAI83_07950 [Thiomargarita sp.]|nr:hypothetical protein [Thiomargarita sp.]